MSHTVRSTVQFDSLDAVDEFARLVGGEVRRGQTTFVRYQKQPGKCLHAIRVPGASYEIGIERKADGTGYAFVCDPWHGGGLDKIVGPKLEKLPNLWAAAKGIHLCKLAGKTGISHRTLADGAIVVTSMGGW